MTSTSPAELSQPGTATRCRPTNQSQFSFRFSTNREQSGPTISSELPTIRELSIQTYHCSLSKVVNSDQLAL